MRIIGISEHFHPRVGGTVEYVVRTCSALQALGHTIHLVVPGEGQDREQIVESRLPFQVTSLGVGWPNTGDPDRETRYRFCERVEEFMNEAIEDGVVDLIHVLFGLFVNETLNTARLRNEGIPCVTTIHNVPPQECGRSWSGDRLLDRWKDRLRLKVVAAKNRKRLCAHDYDAWVVPSEISGKLLQDVRKGIRIEVIGHGCSDSLLNEIKVPQSRAPGPGEPLKILTVGGWVPHKRQHLIPEVAEHLRDQGLNLVWDLVGPPARVPRYQTTIINEIEKRGLNQIVKAHGAVPFKELSKFYEGAHLYVQPSIEEGFCMTALDAAAVGLPVIGCPAGALPEICRASEGVLVPSEAEDIAHAIEHFYVAGLWSGDARKLGGRVQKQFKWCLAARALDQLYQKISKADLVEH